MKTKKQNGNLSFARQLLNSRWMMLGMVFIAFAGVAIAAETARKQSLLDLFSNDKAVDLMAKLDLFKGLLEGKTAEEVCPELNRYVAMCNLFQSDFVTVDGSMEVSDCAAGEQWGQASNPAALLCNFAKIMKAALPEDVVEKCAEMPQQTFGQ